jgi:hypothetical protein
MFRLRALFGAAASGDATILEESSDDDLRVFDPVTGDTLVHVATQRRQVGIVELLIARVPDTLWARNTIGRTALLEAVLYDHVEIARMVCAAEPRALFVKDLYGNSPLQSTDLLDSLDDVTWSYTTPLMGLTIMHEAVIHGMDHVVHLAARKIPWAIRGATIDGMTPIHLAAFLGRTEAVDILLRELPECIEFVTPSGKTPLFCAAEYSPWKNSRVIRTLFEKRPDLAKAQDARGRTPVFEISKNGIADDVRFMLDAYPELALVQERTLGWTPLHAALYGRYNSWADMARTIATACPDALRVKDLSGRTPIDHARLALDPREEECGEFLSCVLKHAELPNELWEYIPRGCEHVSAALGPALGRSLEEAGRVVRKMTDEHRERLRTALLAISREMTKRRVYLEDATRRIASGIF